MPVCAPNGSWTVGFQARPWKICYGRSETDRYFTVTVLQFSPVSIIPTFLHTHSSTYHPRCIKFYPSTSVFACQYHSTIAPYSFIHLPPTLYNIFSPSTSFFHCQYHSTIAPYSFIYHRRCIMFFSQYFSFSLSVSFHHCSIPIHSSTTHAV